MSKYLFLLILIFPPLAFSEPIKIGVNTFLTGSAAFWGEMSTKGLELALNEENDSGGMKGRKIELLYSDFGDLNYAAAVSAAHKFIDIDRVPVIFANVAEDTGVIYPIASPAHIPVVAIAVGSEAVTFEKPGLFRTTSSDLVLWKKSVDYLAAKKLSKGCWAVMQSEYFLDMSRRLEPYWREQFNNEPYIEAFNTDQRDFGALALRFKQKQCQSLLLMSWIGPASEIIKKSASLDFRPQWIGPTSVSDSPDFLNLVQNMAEGLVFGKFSVGTPAFVEKFKNKYGRPPERPAATSYDALKLVAKVMREHGTAPKDIMKGLSQTKNFTGASGSLSFNANGTRSDEDYELLAIRDSTAVPIKVD